MDKTVSKKIASYPDPIKKKLLYLRELILDVAKNTEGVGSIEETLKWDQLSYLTSETKSGTTIRIDWRPQKPDEYALYVNCKTNLIDQYTTLFPKEFSYEGNRAIVFNINEKIPEDALRICIQIALRYHLDKKG